MLNTSTRVLSARYSMLADFYPEVVEKTESGQVKRFWDRDNPYVVRNRTDGILVQGFTSVASTEKWDKDYQPVEYAKMYIQSQVVDDDDRGAVTLNRTFRVSNIRDRATDQVLWLNEQRIPIEFNVMGITPIQDPFGRNVEFEILLKGVISDGRA